MTNIIKLSPLPLRRRLLNYTVIALIAATLLGLTWAAQGIIPIGEDWRETFSRLSVRWPYEHNASATPAHKFYGVPWTMLLLPHALLPLELGNAINFLLNLTVPLAVIAKLKGGYRAMVIVYLSPFYFQVVAVNNIDWVPLLAFLMPASFAPILFSIKPQSLGGALLIFTKQAWQRWRWRGALIFAPLALLLTASVFVWPGWWHAVGAPPLDANINAAPFPVLVPFGLWLMYRAWKEDDAIMAACATPFLVPYMTPYAATATMTVLACKHPRAAFAAWIATWVVAGVAIRGMIL